MNISEKKLRKIIRGEIKNNLNEGIFDNLFGSNRLLSQELIDLHIDNFHTAYIVYFALQRKNKSRLNSEYIDMLQVVNDFKKDLKNAKLGSVPQTIKNAGYAPSESWKKLIAFAKVRNLKEIIDSKGGIEQLLYTDPNIDPLYKRYEILLLAYLRKNFRR